MKKKTKYPRIIENPLLPPSSSPHPTCYTQHINMSFSKSMFSNSPQNAYRTIYNPVEQILPISDELSSINKNDQLSLTVIQNRYVNPAAKKQYENLSKDYFEYIRLYMVIRSIKYKTKNKSLLSLLNIVEDALVASINIYALYGENVMLKIDKSNLETKIQEILSDKNNITINMMNTSGQLKITKTFKLKAIFNHYILIYGMPAFGVGFEPVKIAFLEEIMKKNGVNPYR